MADAIPMIRRCLEAQWRSLDTWARVICEKYQGDMCGIEFTPPGIRATHHLWPLWELVAPPSAGSRYLVSIKEELVTLGMDISASDHSVGGAIA